MKWSIPERIIEQGRKLVDDKRVLSIHSILEKRIWTAEVLEDDVYQVELDGTTKEEDFCSCDYWKNHGHCKHTVAVELALRDRGISRVMTPDNAEEVEIEMPDPGKELTKTFSRVFFNEQLINDTAPSQQQTNLQIEYKLEHKPDNAALLRNPNEVLVISLRAGTDKLYVVKDLMAFLESFIRHETFELNAHEEIDFKTVSITEEDHQSLVFMYQEAASNQFIRGQYNEPKSIFNNKRFLVLSPSHAENLINCIQKTEHMIFQSETGKYPHVRFIQDEVPMLFEMDYQDNAVVFSIQDLKEADLKHYHWFIKDNLFYIPSWKQLETIKPLRTFLAKYKGDQILIHPEEMPDFTAYVLPLVSTLGEVRMSEQMKQSFVQEPLKSCIYFSYRHEKLEAVVEFNYRHMVLSTDPKETQLPDENIQVIRESQKEIHLLNLLKQLGYEREETSYTKRVVRDEGFYTFFTKEISLLEEEAEVYVDDVLDQLFLNELDTVTKVDVAESGSFLDVHFDIKGITDNEVDAVLSSLMARKKFHTLNNGKILSLETDDFHEISTVLRELRASKDFQNGSVQVPSYRGLELESVLDKEKGSKRDLSKSFQDMVFYLNDPETFAVDVPKQLQGTLRPYQMTGFKWLSMLSTYGFGGILADDMGLGKTIQMITYILSEVEKNEKAPFLIIAPASLTYNWFHEMKKFAPSIECQVVSGSIEERKTKIQEVKPNTVLITSYQSFRQDAEVYKTQQFSTLILDESQMVKNYHTKTSKALRDLPVPQKFALSGTPIENKIDELWSIFQLIMPGFFPSIKKFRSLPNERIAKMIQPFVLRRVKKDVLKELPKKIETNLYSSLSKEQKTIYLAYLQQIQESVLNMSGDEFKRHRIEILSGLTRLRQICCDPRLFMDDYEGESGKLEQLKEMVANGLENGKRMLIFSQFTSMLDIIQKELAAQEIESFYLSGKTKPVERIEMVNQFNQGEKSIFLISLKAGGTGLNLTGADTVILYDLWWNPAVEEQAAGRAHRIGQKNVVEVWRMIAEGTIEEKINALQKEKKSLFDQIITEEHADTKLQKQLTEEDIREILSIGGVTE
ncbi:DEAD/DEAH box helicase [Pisciglobus halotolerans]|uniref:Superfamily II DNA or RNA helicase, SNF2 family n=1 Tax=Pisciglobus halotolerans TaxID=745365 RepID=A0A1I3BYK1_9LACT|nr:DEAD/DEAH box helicase [Pisciglobus halotolerans]SFH67384.1 Superfamily II DNA or RNA helicase, SNF2 family [Pisciglobus halotolerans]